MKRQAYFNDERTKRYLLVRDWSESAESRRVVNFIGINPSIADAETDDMTVRKDIGFAKRWGFNCVVLTNLIPDISTDPWKLPYWKGFDQDNLMHLDGQIRQSDLVIAAWGNQPRAIAERVALSEHIIRLRDTATRTIHCIGLTKGGYPLHPSRTAYTDAPFHYWTIAGGNGGERTSEEG